MTSENMITDITENVLGIYVIGQNESHNLPQASIHIYRTMG